MCVFVYSCNFTCLQNTSHRKEEVKYKKPVIFTDLWRDMSASPRAENALAK
jgi:hypothetical protein